MRKEAIAQQTLKILSKIGVIISAIGILVVAFAWGYSYGRTKTIKEADPFTMDGIQYIQYGEETHDYGESIYVIVETFN